MKKIIVVVSFIFLAILSTMGQTSSTGSSYISTAVPFLTITPDSRAAGMGDVGAATSADINSIHWNASKSVFAKKKSGLSLSYTPWLKEIAAGMSLGYFSAYHKIDNIQAISGSFRYFNLGEIEYITNSNDPVRTVNPSELAIDLAYSRKLAENFSMGVAFRYIRSSIIEDRTASSIAADVSCFYTKILEGGNIAFGVNISNIGSKITYSDDSYFIPTNFKLGTTYTKNLSTDIKLALSLDLNKLLVDAGDMSSTTAQKGVIMLGNKSNEDVLSSMITSVGQFSSITYSFGTECTFQDMLNLRLGYFYENKDAGDRNYLTTGLGVIYKDIAFDLAYLISTNTNNPLKNTLRFTIGYNF